MSFGKTHFALVLLTAWLFLKFFSVDRHEFDPDKLIKDKKVLVTGASSGIGRVTALRLCRLGANVYITARSEDKLKQVVAECSKIGAEGAKHGFVTGDMADLEQSERVVHESVNALGGLDYLILNHAYTDLRLFDMYQYTTEDLKDLKRIFDINFFSFVSMTSAAMKYLRKANGKVAVISSLSGKRADMMVSKYAASKHAVEGFFRSIDLENYFLETNVSFTVASLGTVDTKKEHIMEDAILMMNRLTSYGVDFQKMFSVYNSPANVEECADQIIRSTAMREPETYFPTDYSGWWPALKPLLFPYSARKVAEDSKLPKQQ